MAHSASLRPFRAASTEPGETKVMPSASRISCSCPRKKQNRKPAFFSALACATATPGAISRQSGSASR
ncbi:hypothetical protein AYO46_08960 [Betaproteobacteria bacterium SCGC AG-212-J23]|nr:hypothetical protein AYO46_08960 [Betaproteobacteria bacterium SCGC AG-212-J23]